MTRSTWDDFVAVLRNKPCGTAPPWSQQVSDDYYRWFGGWPDFITKMVTAYMLIKCDFRPDPKVIFEIRSEIERQGDPQSLDRALTEVRYMINTYGTRPVQEGWFVAEFWDYSTTPPTKTVRKRADGSEIVWPKMVEGMPNFSDPDIAQVVEAMGGWTEFVEMTQRTGQEFWGPQFERLYKGVKRDRGGDAMRQLRLAYREAALAAPERFLALTGPAGDEDVSPGAAMPLRGILDAIATGSDGEGVVIPLPKGDGEDWGF